MIIWPQKSLAVGLLALAGHSRIGIGHQILESSSTQSFVRKSLPIQKQIMLKQALYRYLLRLGPRRPSVRLLPHFRWTDSLSSNSISLNTKRTLHRTLSIKESTVMRNASLSDSSFQSTLVFTASNTLEQP